MPSSGKKLGEELSKKFSKLIYALAFQAGWFLCIIMENSAGILYTLVFLVCHFWFLAHDNPRFFLYKEVLWVVIITCIGLAVEIISFSSGLLYINSQKALSYNLQLPPAWLVCIWIMFALALRTCLSFLFNNPVVGYLTCLIFVPINYYAGVNLNHNVAIGEPIFLSLTLITFMWVLFLSCSIYLKRHFFEEIFDVN